MKKAPKNQKELAARLGVSRQTLAHHMKQLDAPPLGDVKGWNVFLAAHGRDGSSPGDLKRALAEKRLSILAETERQLKRENAIAEGKTVSKDEVSTGIKSAMALLFGELDRLFLNELPPALKGLDELAIKSRCNGAIGQLRQSLRERFGKMGGAE